MQRYRPIGACALALAAAIAVFASGEIKMTHFMQSYDAWVRVCRKIDQNLATSGGVARSGLINYTIVEEFGALENAARAEKEQLLAVLNDYVAGKSPNPGYDYYLKVIAFRLYALDELAIIGPLTEGERKSVLADKRKYIALILSKIPSAGTP